MNWRRLSFTKLISELPLVDKNQLLNTQQTTTIKMPTLRSGTHSRSVSIAPPDYTPVKLYQVVAVALAVAVASGVALIAASSHSSYSSSTVMLNLAMELEPFSTSGGIKFVGVLDKGLNSNKIRRLVRGEFNCSHCNKNANLLMRMVGTNTHIGGFCQRLYSGTPNQAVASQPTSSSVTSRIVIKVATTSSSCAYCHTRVTCGSESEPAHATLRAYVGETTETDRASKFYGETFLHYLEKHVTKTSTTRLT